MNALAARATRRGGRLAAEPRAPGPAMALLRQLADREFLVAFAMFAPLCFLLQLGAKGAAVFCLVTLAYTVLRRRELFGILATRGFLLVPAGIACFSVLWSTSRIDSLKGGVELGLTLLAAILLSGSPRPQMILRGVAGAFAVYLAISLVAGGTTKMGLHGTAFSGLSASKNLLADIAATGAIFSAGAAWLALRDRAWLWVTALCGVLGLALLTLVMAKSAGAMVSLAVGLGALAFLAGVRSLESGLRALLVCLGGIFVVVFAFLHRPISDALVQYVTALFDKDPTLTGRTYIWERGYELVRERPLLGQGFGAFWRQGNPDAEGLWQYAGIQQRSGFTFHNSVLEVLVQLGWTGVGLLGLVLAFGALCLAIRFAARPTPALCVWGGAFAFELSRMPVESIGYQPFFYSTVIITAALAMAFSSSASTDSAARGEADVRAPSPPRRYRQRRLA